MPLKELTVTDGRAPKARLGPAAWGILALLLCGGIINYLDRASLSLAAPEMIKDLGLTTTDIGLMGTVFSWTYAVMQLPAGWLVDRFGSRTVYSCAITLWSAAIALMGLCSRMPQFLAARVGLGIGEAPCFPASAKITTERFARGHRGLVTAIWDSSSKWGPALAPLLLIPLLTSFGWRNLFYVIGVAGLGFALVFRAAYRNPHRGEQTARAHPDRVSWARLFTERTVWGLILGFFCTIWVWNIFLTFLPLYLLDTQGLELAKLGVWASIPWCGGIVGELTAGYVSSRIIARGAPALTVRRALIAVCTLLAGASVVALPLVHGLVPTVVTLAVALGFVSAATGGAWALPGDVAPAHLVGSVSAIQNFGGYFGGAFSPLVAGVIVDTTGSWSLAFYSAGIIAALAGACYWFVVRGSLRSTTAPGTPAET